ncbi:bifunctional dihydroneopterin aldolase/dihydroneopterin triphosphate 2'-epimerase [Candidatus Xiphinematobacter sp. Idaho Grape]|uniref:dihydroneopterin aldolase n=1 Tax=Candidatus Xiphinematobacter sp. Idaho Grape TaxID=1704307 RepID=UPI000705E988|nr:dihydroneopterin aldolase [Candidatus Xiphinematobacter sp. Idaho Grape]ALJ56483.1 bifunctional dihydroneopterin aldolase/dihydroneopterin triphosphate 2'-epimerase [Candidatus Xiphinematobacter sp. Idaho Grape]
MLEFPAEPQLSPFSVLEDDVIQIQGLSVCTRIGTTEEEHLFHQHLLLDLQIQPQSPFSAQKSTQPSVDYSALAQRIRSLCAVGQWRLMETLAAEISDTLLLEFPVKRLTLRIRKFVLPYAEFVAVQTTRER